MSVNAQMHGCETAPMRWQQSIEKAEGIQAPSLYYPGGSGNYVPSKKQKSGVTYTPFGYIRSTEFVANIFGESAASFSPSYNYDLTTYTLFPDSLAVSYMYFTNAPSNSYNRPHIPAIGYVFDPYSKAFDYNFQYGLFEDQLTNEIYGYSIDTLVVRGDYRIANYNPASPDTLRVFLSYYNVYRYPYGNPDPKNGQEYFSLTYTSGSYAGARLLAPVVQYDNRNNIAQKGPVTRPAATNTVTIDYILSDKDSAITPIGFYNAKMIFIPINDYIGNNFEVPVGSVTSVIMKFIPGYNYNNGDTIRKSSYNSSTATWVAEDINKNVFSTLVVNNTQDFGTFLDLGGGVNGRLMESQDVRYDKDFTNTNAPWNPNHHSIYSNGYYPIPCVYMVISTGDDYWNPLSKAPTYTIRGSVKENGMPKSGVTITCSNGAVIATDVNGEYSIVVDSNASVTLTPSFPKYLFSPSVITCSNIASNLNNQDFVARPIPTYTIKGYVDLGGNPLAGLSIACSNGSTITTDVNGEYSLTVDSNATITLTPSLAKHTFSPPFITCSKVASNLNNQNFIATPFPKYTIQGGVYISENDNPLVGVNIACSDGSSTTTDANGEYLIILDSNETVTLTPSLAGYNFAPEYIPFSNITNNYNNQDFVALPIPKYTIEGNVSSNKNGNPIAGVNIACTNGSSATTNTNGDYSLIVDSNETVTLTPSLEGYEFFPKSTTLSKVASNLSFQNFTATVEPEGGISIINGKSPIKISPNPTTGQLRITNYELRENDIVEIYSVVGQKLNNYQLSIINCQLVIDVSPLAAGMYYLKIAGQTIKFVKQ